MKEKGATSERNTTINTKIPTIPKTQSSLRTISLDATTITYGSGLASTSKQAADANFRMATEGTRMPLPQQMRSPSPPLHSKSSIVPQQTLNKALELISNARQLHDTTTAAVAAAGMQQVHIISSSDDEYEKAMSCSIGSGFAGFSSTGAPTLHEEMTPPGVFKRRMKRHSQTGVASISDDENDGKKSADVGSSIGDQLRQNRSSVNSLRGSAVIDADVESQEPVTPVKRKRRLNEGYIAAERKTLTTAAQLQAVAAPEEHIFEITSNSTTGTERQKRLIRNAKIKLHVNVNNKYCSTDSTSEFPISSPSNPQAGASKYYQRPPLLKNTLPADSFERNLAIITANSPQISTEDKIDGWQCDTELSDVEDVNNFDDLFKKHEEIKRKVLQAKKAGYTVDSDSLTIDVDIYDFKQFHSRMLKSVNLNTKLANLGNKTSNESSIDPEHRPTTSGAATYLNATQRRMKLASEGELRKRQTRASDYKNTGAQSTTPPVSSSSDNDELPVYHPSVTMKKKTFNTQKSPLKILVHEKILCPSSSEETSQDVITPAATDSSMPNTKPSTSNTMTSVHKLQPTSTVTIVPKPEKQPQLQQDQMETDIGTTTTFATAASAGAAAAPAFAVTAAINIKPQLQQQDQSYSPPLNLHLTSTDEESVFKLHRLNREIDKNSCGEPQPLIQMRLDFTNDKKDMHLQEKKSELFKTPIVPQKYMPATVPAPAILTTTTSIIFNNNESDNNVAAINQQKSSPISIYSISSGGAESPIQQYTKETSKSPDSVTSAAAAAVQIGNDDDGCDAEFHEQHEFCNYLGLTGMSTAHAVANAVAELAQCKLARRSLRVRRLQQQEKKEKFMKEGEQHLKNLKIKQLQQLKRRELGGEENMSRESDISENIVAVARANAEASGKTASLDATPKFIQSNENRIGSKAVDSLQPLIKYHQKEPGIKILCQISASNKDRSSEEVTKSCAKEIAAPIRQTLLRHLKKGNARGVGAVSSNGTSTCPRSSRSENDYAEDMSSNHTTPKHHSEDNTMLSSSPINTQCYGASSSHSPNSIGISPRQLVKGEKNITAARAAPVKIKTMKNHFQMCLEESRKSKPSIFIVQSLNSGKASTSNNSSSSKNAATTAIAATPARTTNKVLKSKSAPVNLQKPSDQRGKMQLKSKQHSRRKLQKHLSSLHGHRSKERLHQLLTRSAFSFGQRQLRSRKILIVKTIKRAPKPRTTEKATQKGSDTKPSDTTASSDLVMSASLANKSQMMLRNNAEKSKTPIPVGGDGEENNAVIKKKNNNATTKNVKKLLNARVAAAKTKIVHATKMYRLRKKLSLNNNNLNKKQSGKITQKTIAENKIRKVTRNEMLEIEQSQQQQQQIHSPPHPTPTVEKRRFPTNDNESVVVSSTTNSYDVAMLSMTTHVAVAAVPATITTAAADSPLPLPPLNNEHREVTKEISRNVSYIIQTKDSATQCSNKNTDGDVIRYLSKPSTSVHRNPIKSDHGRIIYMFYEMDVLIVVQELHISFWKHSKIINLLSTSPPSAHHALKQSPMAHFVQTQTEGHVQQTTSAITMSPSIAFDCLDNDDVKVVASAGEWINLSGCRRLIHDLEISTPYANRICVHNSIPIYIEMRCREIPRERRDCNLLSLYINVYYFHDDDMHAKMHSIQLDAVQSLPTSVIYTAIPESRYFVLTWPQENIVGKTRSGLCKYSLTPHLDTLASIRDFKSMRHEIRYLECTGDDKLLGFGDTQLTIWDHRSGDVLMNYDLNVALGRNLGSIYYPSLEIGQNSMILLFQYIYNLKSQPELLVIACCISHAAPSHRILKCHSLPSPAFKRIASSINTSEHVVITADNDEEIWISCIDPNTITCLPAQHTQRFYAHGRTQLIEVTPKTLTVDSFANHVLKMAAGAKLNVKNA